MEPFLCLAPPDPVVRGEGMTHPGEDFIFVLEGKILSTIGGEQYTLGPGDAIYYDCTIPHWGRGLTGSESTILNTNTVWAPMKSGAPQRTNFDNGLNPWRNQWMSGLHNWEQHASLFKVIPLKERVSLRLNIDFFNVFNMPGIPKTPDSATGIINAQTSGNGSRSLQFGLRLNW
jgi:hypothetical protein